MVVRVSWSTHYDMWSFELTYLLWLRRVHICVFIHFFAFFDAAGFQEAHLDMMRKNDLVYLLRRLKWKHGLWCLRCYRDVSLRCLARYGLALQCAVSFAMCEWRVLYAGLHCHLTTIHLLNIHRHHNLVIILINNDGRTRLLLRLVVLKLVKFKVLLNNNWLVNWITAMMTG